MRERRLVIARLRLFRLLRAFCCSIHAGESAQDLSLLEGALSGPRLRQRHNRRLVDVVTLVLLP